MMTIKIGNNASLVFLIVAVLSLLHRTSISLVVAGGGAFFCCYRPSRPPIFSTRGAISAAVEQTRRRRRIKRTDRIHSVNGIWYSTTGGDIPPPPPPPPFDDRSTSKQQEKDDDDDTKTYGKDTIAGSPISDIVDVDAAMNEFFTSREEWIPLFRNMAYSSSTSTTNFISCPASQFIKIHDSTVNSADSGNDEVASTSSSSSSSTTSAPPLGEQVTLAAGSTTSSNSEDPASMIEDMMLSSPQQRSFVFDETSWPWRRLAAIPHLEEDRIILSGFLDAMHKSLLDIPVTDSTTTSTNLALASTTTIMDDENDVHFLEEGRRMLALTRFHVLHDINVGSLDGYDTLFNTCWSELMELTIRNENHTGSLILLPNYDNVSDLRRFADMNLHRPLEWLGIHNHFEIASMHRDSPAIRLLYKLNDLPESSSSTSSTSSSSETKLP